MNNNSKILAAAKSDAAIYANDYPGETYTADSGDWDAESWASSRGELGLSGAELADAWDVYRAALHAEISELAGAWCALRDVYRAAISGLPLDLADVATVNAERGVITLRHVWPEDVDGRVWSAILRCATREAERIAPAAKGGTVEIYAAEGHVVATVDADLPSETKYQIRGRIVGGAWSTEHEVFDSREDAERAIESLERENDDGDTLEYTVTEVQS